MDLPSSDGSRGATVSRSICRPMQRVCRAGTCRCFDSCDAAECGARGIRARRGARRIRDADLGWCMVVMNGIVGARQFLEFDSPGAFNVLAVTGDTSAIRRRLRASRWPRRSSLRARLLAGCRCSRLGVHPTIDLRTCCSSARSTPTTSRPPCRTSTRTRRWMSPGSRRRPR